MLGWMSCLLMTAVSALPAETADTASAPVGRQIDDFSLQDYRGKRVSLSDFKDKKLVVVAFIGIECPLARLYVPKLQDLAKKFESNGVAAVAIDSNVQDSLADLEAFTQEFKLTIPLLKDPGNKIADAFGAKRTPEFFLLGENGKVVYHGRFDDQYGLGRTSSYAKYTVHRHDVIEAIEETLAGKPISVPETEAAGCIIGRVPKPESTASGNVTYTKQIAKLMQDHCVDCHREGEVAPFSLTSYDEVVGWGETICEVVDQNRMPPWFANPEYGKFANDCRLSDKDKKVLQEWVEQGSPEGDPKDLPKPKEYTVGWRIPEPDQVIHTSKRPYKVKAEGIIPYQYMIVDPGWKEDKWIKAAEARPGNRQVVHHIIVFVAPPGIGGLLGRGLLGGRGGGERGGGGIAGLRRGGAGAEAGGSGLAAYAPGNSATILPEGSAIHVPAGSTLVFQMHYTANGTPQQDISSVGVVFADPKEVKKKIINGAISNRRFLIPPGDGNYRVEADRVVPEDVLLLSLAPHMHLRGKSFNFTAEYPDGSKEVLLDVPHYDPDWQLTYMLEEPKLIPAGTKVRCVAHFDNSPENLSNPDPKKSVRFGPQTWDEMMIGFFRAIPTKELATPGTPGPSDRQPLGDRPLSKR